MNTPMQVYQAPCAVFTHVSLEPTLVVARHANCYAELSFDTDMKTPQQMVNAAQKLCEQSEVFGDTNDSNYPTLKAKLMLVGTRMHVFFIPPPRKSGGMRVTSGYASATLCASHFKTASKEGSVDQDTLRYATCRYYCGESTLLEPPVFERARLKGMPQNVVDLFNPNIFGNEFNEVKYKAETCQYANLLPSKNSNLETTLASNLPEGWQPVNYPQGRNFVVPPKEAIGRLAIPLFTRGGSLRYDTSDIPGFSVQRLPHGLVLAQWCHCTDVAFEDVALRAGSACTSLSTESLPLAPVPADQRCIFAAREAIAGEGCPETLHLEITTASVVHKQQVSVLPAPFLLYSSCATVEIATAMGDKIYHLKPCSSSIGADGTAELANGAMTQQDMTLDLQSDIDKFEQASEEAAAFNENKRRHDESYVVHCAAYNDAKRKVQKATEAKQLQAAESQELLAQAKSYETQTQAFRSMCEGLA